MALSDPQTLTIATVAIPVPRVSTGPSSSVYSSADGNTQLTVSHAYGKRNRRSVRVRHAKLTSDPITGLNVYRDMTAYVVLDTPKDGYSISQQIEVLKGLTDFLSAGTFSASTKVAGGES